MDFDIYQTYNGQRVYDDVNYKSFREFQKRHPQPLIPTTNTVADTNHKNAVARDVEAILRGPSEALRRSLEMAMGGESARDARIYHIFANFNIYNTLEEIFTEWPGASGNPFEVKFIKPTDLASWQSVIYRCATMVKVLKTLGCLMDAHTKEYKFSYENKTFFKTTTYQFSYDPANYRFTIKTGQAIIQNIAKNWLLCLHASALGQLHSLLRTMRYELPQVHFDKVYDLYVLIKDKPTAKLILS